MGYVPDVYDVLDEYQRQEDREEEEYLDSLPDNKTSEDNGDA